MKKVFRPQNHYQAAWVQAVLCPEPCVRLTEGGTFPRAPQLGEPHLPRLPRTVPVVTPKVPSVSPETLQSWANETVGHAKSSASLLYKRQNPAPFGLLQSHFGLIVIKSSFPWWPRVAGGEAPRNSQDLDAFAEMLPWSRGCWSESPSFHRGRS